MALYRKYRPASFAEMIGQEQVTRPLSTALDNGRVNHAYLFSGPRGTGKTSSARILARSLNCAQGPTSTPCGVCPSCVALAPGGPGNLDVTEMDAASNGGVDEMRELRERAHFAPAESRYRVFIIDEAHMITGAGANALLKIVEEPPEHLVFIFATTEPEKIIGTIRSRTHHYPFRLLTPQAMRALLERTIAAEGVSIDENVYPLVIRAGGGSPRDTLSILDQLLAGAGPEGLTYELALPLLGVTDLSLIDATVDALAARDAAALFQAVDDVIEAGHEPRRFAIDLLDRLRDLMIIHAVPDAFGQGLVDAPTDRAEILTAEADKFPGNQLASLATEVNERITSLKGATSPRLLLEVMMAHLLGVLAGTQAPAVVSGLEEIRDASTAAVGAADQPRGAAAAIAAAAAVQATANVTSQSTPAPREAPKPEPKPAPAPTPQPAPAAQAEPEPQQQPEAQPEAHAEPNEAPDEDLMGRIHKEWITLRQYVGERNKVAEIMLTEATPLGMEGTTLVVGHNTGALAERINSEHNNKDIVAALSEKLGTQIAVRCVVGTDPKAEGFSPVQAEPAAWNPSAKLQAEATETADEVREEPAARTPEPAPTPAQEQPEQAKPAQASEASPDPWARPPRKVGGEAEGHTHFSDGAPLPPEPADPDEPEPVEDAGAAQKDTEPEYTREDEERDMVNQSMEAGELDRRNPTEVAMDVLAEELGARPL